MDNQNRVTNKKKIKIEEESRLTIGLVNNTPKTNKTNEIKRSVVAGKYTLLSVEQAIGLTCSMCILTLNELSNYNI